MSRVEIGKNGKTYEEAFASFRNEVLDVLAMERTGEKFKRELLSKVVLAPNWVLPCALPHQRRSPSTTWREA